MASAIATISSIRAQQSSTTSQPAAIAPAALSAGVPASAFMSMSSVISRPSKPIMPRITCSMMTGDSVAGRSVSQAGNRMCDVMPIPAPASARKGARSTSSASAGASTVGR
jgi:hypothetical protein